MKCYNIDKGKGRKPKGKAAKIMKNLMLVDLNKKVSQTYELNEISNIMTDKAEFILDINELKNNKIKPNATVTVIYLANGEKAIFEAKNWIMYFK